MAKEPQVAVIAFPKQRKRAEKARKSGLNHNKEGSIRNVNGSVYVDFMYLDERVRETSGLPWNEQSAKEVRAQLDRIIVAIQDGAFRFAEIFPQSKKAKYFDLREKEIRGLKSGPDEITFDEYAREWFELLEGSGRISGRTLWAYKGYLKHYLLPFFGKKTFGEINAHSLEEFVSWSRKKKLRLRVVCNKSINRYMIPLKMICKQAAIKFRWGGRFDPFFGFKKLPEEDMIEKIVPFSLEEQMSLRKELPDHWKPYFDFAFRSGLRPGEQIGMKPEDIDWEKGLLHVRRAITLDANGKRFEGMTKNKFSRRTIQLTPAMFESLKAQKAIHDQFGCEYFFCTPKGYAIHLTNLRKNVWIPALKNASLPLREMKQTRHTFATMALSYGENPLWIARVMGHRDIEMIIKVYTRYVANSKGTEDGSLLNAAYCQVTGNNG
jgi:integrase